MLLPSSAAARSIGFLIGRGTRASKRSVTGFKGDFRVAVFMEKIHRHFAVKQTRGPTSHILRLKSSKTNKLTNNRNTLQPMNHWGLRRFDLAEIHRNLANLDAKNVYSWKMHLSWDLDGGGGTRGLCRHRKWISYSL
jgi:hypothetical protein